VHAFLIGTGAAALFGFITASCFNYLDDCWRYAVCSSEATGSSSGSSGDGGVDPKCVPSANDSPIAESCGVFVSSSQGNDANDGTQDKPIKTLAKALQLAVKDSKPVYACAETFNEAVSLEAGAALYGGLECTNSWRYVGETTKTMLAPGPALIPLTLAGGTGSTHIEDVLFKAADAMAEGGSSIAAVAGDGATVELMRCELIAGSGRDGVMGASPTDSLGPFDQNDPAIRGADGAAACSGDVATGNPGGAGTQNALCSASAGGNGGAGQITNGEDGTDGSPAGAFGLHGTGQPAMGVWSCGLGNGKIGDSGANGANGAGAQGDTGLGTLTTEGLTGAAGEPGKDGAPGQGGGGGGGAKGKAACNGASGGGGGAGGCGGKGGLGGQAGGASIALVSLGASLSFTEVKLTAANGGIGGEGGYGQGAAPGGNGGIGGPGDLSSPITSKACSGGEGGAGGTGGKGGGGRGGHSLGIAFTGAPPQTDGVTITTGTPGKGGPGADMAGQGADGVKADTQAFP
jgi:hypothetical protein